VSSSRRHTGWPRDWSSDVCSSDLGSDYVALSGTVEIPVGQADEGIVVVPIDDQLVEGSESVVVELTVPTVGPGELPPYAISAPRSEERRVGKECRWRGSPYRVKKK